MPVATPDELPIRFAAAINEGDLAAALELWSEQARIVTAQGETVCGRPAIARVLGALIDNGVRIEIATTAVHCSGDVALAAGELTLRPADGEGLRSRALAVYERTPAGSWQIAIDAPWGLPPTNGALPDHQRSPARQSHVSSASGSRGAPTSST